MGGSQGVPTWVPVLVGVLGMLGVITGQLINAWREDRRWKREQRREDIRWEREKYKEQHSRVHDLQKQVREERIKIYVKLIDSVDPLRHKLVILGINGAEEYTQRRPQMFDEIALAQRDLLSALHQVMLIGTTEVARAAQRLVGTCNSAVRAIYASGSSESSSDMEVADRESLEISVAVGKFVATARREYVPQGDLGSSSLEDP